MDVSDFVQCLEYINRQTSNGKTLYEQYAPTINVLTGVLIGFFLNKLSDILKFRKDEGLKIKVIEEEIKRVREQFEGTFREAIRLGSLAVAGKASNSYILPPRVGLDCTKTFLTIISYRFSAEKRLAAFNLMSSVDLLNKILDDFHGDDQPANANEQANMSATLASVASRCYYLCEDFEGKFNNNHLKGTADLAETFNLAGEYFVQQIKAHESTTQ